MENENLDTALRTIIRYLRRKRFYSGSRRFGYAKYAWKNIVIDTKTEQIGENPTEMFEIEGRGFTATFHVNFHTKQTLKLELNGDYKRVAGDASLIRLKFAGT